MMDLARKESEFLLYTAPNRAVKVGVLFRDETDPGGPRADVWHSQGLPPPSLEHFVVAPYCFEFERKFADRPALVARYLDGFVRFLREHGELASEDSRDPPLEVGVVGDQLADDRQHRVPLRVV